MNKLREVIGDYEDFIERTDAGINALDIDCTDLAMMDHICYRVETNRRYYELLRQLGRQAKLLGESQISGRSIATFELEEPIEAYGWQVPYLELPQPKQGSPYEEGLEHAEFVTAGSLDWFEQKYKHLPFTHNGMNKKINPELGLQHAGISVKFHEQPLGAVVRIENRTGIRD